MTMNPEFEEERNNECQWNLKIRFIPWKWFDLQGFWPWQYVLQNYHLGGAKKHISINLKTQEMQPEWKKLLFTRNQIELIFTNCNFDGVSARIKEALPSFQGCAE